MLKNPSIVIIHKLNKKQIEFVKDKLADDLRKTSLKLFNIIHSCRSKEIDKKLIFKKLFSYNHSEEKDYLLRNEFRILRQKLDDCLISLSIEDELKNNHFYRVKQRLYAYKHLGFDELFTDEYENTIKTAKENLAFEDAISIHRWAMDQAYHHKLTQLVTYEDKVLFFKTITESCHQSLQHYTATINRINAFFTTVSHHYNVLNGQADNVSLKDQPKSVEIEDHPLSLYYLYRTKGFESKGLEKVQYFIKSLEQISNYPIKNNYLNSLALNTITNIGRSLLQSGDHSMALEYLTKGVAEYLPSISNYPATEKLYANYIVALLNTYNYEKALENLITLEAENADHNYTFNWFNIYKIVCYAGLKQVDNVSKSMPCNFNNIPPQHRLYYRLLQSIEHYLSNRLEDASRELYNLHKSITKKDNNNTFTKTAELFQTYFSLMEKYKEANLIPTKLTVKFKDSIDNIKTRNISDVNVLPLIYWLKRETICLTLTSETATT